MFARQRPDSTKIAAPPPVARGLGYEVVRFLAEQGLEPTPANYDLIYRAKADRRSLVAMAVDAILMEGRAIDQADVDRIGAAEAKRQATGSTADIDAQQETLRHQALKVAEITAGAVASSSDFGRNLTDGLHRLAGGPASVDAIVSAMVERTRGVEQQLSVASRELEELRQEVETVRGDAMRDALTGLLNRRGIAAELKAREKRLPGTIAMCDVDHFKSINDRFGHAVGDRVLKGVAASLVRSFAPHAVARWGGEEFVVFIDGLQPAKAIEIMERGRRDLAARSFKLRETDEALDQVTVSIGGASLQDVSSDQAIEVADRRLYEAKRMGRNRVIVTDPDCG